MKFYNIVLGMFLVLTLTACSSPQEDAAEAQAEYTEEKTATLKEYKECAKESGGDEVKMKQCDALLKAIQAVEGGN